MANSQGVDKALLFPLPVIFDEVIHADVLAAIPKGVLVIPEATQSDESAAASDERRGAHFVELAESDVLLPGGQDILQLLVL